MTSLPAWNRVFHQAILVKDSVSSILPLLREIIRNKSKTLESVDLMIYSSLPNMYKKYIRKVMVQPKENDLLVTGVGINWKAVCGTKK